MKTEDREVNVPTSVGIVGIVLLCTVLISVFVRIGRDAIDMHLKLACLVIAGLYVVIVFVLIKQIVNHGRNH